LCYGWHQDGITGGGGFTGSTLTFDTAPYIQNAPLFWDYGDAATGAPIVAVNWPNETYPTFSSNFTIWKSIVMFPRPNAQPNIITFSDIDAYLPETYPWEVQLIIIQIPPFLPGNNRYA
jgi:hypothetical protein